MDERLIDFSIPDDVAKRAHQVFQRQIVKFKLNI